MKKNYFIDGIPISNKLKISLVSILIFFLFLNTVIPAIFPSLSYSGNGWVSISIFSIAILLSIGSMGAEGIITGILIVILISNWWDLGIVNDYSELRRNIMIFSLISFIFILSFGKISVTNVYSIIRRSLGQRH